MSDNDVFVTRKVTNKMIYAEIKGLAAALSSIDTRVKINTVRIKMIGGGIGLIGVVIAVVRFVV